MQVQWSAVLAFLGVALAVVAGLAGAARLLVVRARHQAPLKDQTYECGEEPVGGAWVQFHSRYYVVALLFVFFDVEAALLFPWALQTRGAGVAAALAGLFFLGVLMLGWLYALRKGALQWR